jgi:hypothetical protein
VPGAGDGKSAAGGVEAQEAAGREKATAHRDKQVIGAAQHLPRIGRGAGDGPQAGAGLPHAGNGFHVVTLDIADGESDGPIRHREGVVPIAADVQAVP